jgi:hypothetical protein
LLSTQFSNDSSTEAQIGFNIRGAWLRGDEEMNMRKLIATLLAAASLTSPALAQRWRDGDAGVQPAREQTERPERQERRAERQAAQVAQPRQEVRQEARQDRQEFRQERRADRQGFRQERQQDRSAWQAGQYQNREQFQRDRAGAVQDYRRDRTEDRRDYRQDRTQDRRDWQRDRNQSGNWQNRDGSRWSGSSTGSWNRDWRRDQRYNWQDWRQRNRGSYHFPRYYAPRGWSFGYNRFSLGAYLSAPLFAQDYWISDPYEYRLPPAYGPYRWIRYYDDVLLIDIRNGLVVDTIYDFFR